MTVRVVTGHHIAQSSSTITINAHVGGRVELAVEVGIVEHDACNALGIAKPDLVLDSLPRGSVRGGVDGVADEALPRNTTEGNGIDGGIHVLRPFKWSKPSILQLRERP